MPDMIGSSFTHAGVNSFEEWDIKVIAYDVFSPPKRDRRQVVPFRHGSYDYGTKFYNDKIIRLDCDTFSGKIANMSMLREVAYVLSQKDKLYIWTEPDKYYIAELMDSADLNVLPNFVKIQFTLPMVCEPFAYRDVPDLIFGTGGSAIEYEGTKETPCRIIITPEDLTQPINITTGEEVCTILAASEFTSSPTITIDSDEYRVWGTDESENLMRIQTGDWLKISRRIKSIQIDNGTATLHYVERYI